MQLMELHEVDMLAESHKSDGTEKQYKIHREFYLQHNPPPITADPKVLSKFIISYLNAMKKKGSSKSYMNIAKSAIRHYYRNQDEDVILNWDKIGSVIGSVAKKKYDVIGPTHEQIKLLLDLAETKYRAVILTLASTGIRREALVTMKLSDLQYIKEYKLYKFRVYPLTDHEYVTYCTPECAEAIDIYLKKEKPKTYFLEREKGKRQSGPGLSVILRRLILNAKLGTKQDKIGFHDKIPSVHGFKHFTISQMKKAKVDTESRKIMTDHEIGVSGGYMHDMDDDLLKEYIKAISLLTINPDTVKTTISISDNETLAQMMKQKDEEFDELKKKISKLERSNTANFIEMLYEKLKGKGFTGGIEEVVEKLAEHSHFFD